MKITDFWLDDARQMQIGEKAIHVKLDSMTYEIDLKN